MKTEKNILRAFILNLAFSVFEFLGGIYTGSMAVLSDALHDAGDALSIGISLFLEKISKKQPDEKFNFGYGRYSVSGSIITTFILLTGSVTVIFNAVNKIVSPTPVKYNEMIVLAIAGIIVNSCAAYFTHSGHSLNQKAVSLHMLEDVLGWITVLIGAVIIKFTNFTLIDPLMSIGVAVFIIIHAVKILKKSTDILLEKTPSGIDIKEVKKCIYDTGGVSKIHSIYVWSIDGIDNYAVIRITTTENPENVKKKIREKLHGYGICHVFQETE